MFNRSIIIPSLIACAIASPMMFSESNQSASVPARPAAFGSTGLPDVNGFPGLPNQQPSPVGINGSASVARQTIPPANPALQPRLPFRHAPAAQASPIVDLAVTPNRPPGAWNAAPAQPQTASSQPLPGNVPPVAGPHFPSQPQVPVAQGSGATGPFSAAPAIAAQPGPFFNAGFDSGIPAGVPDYGRAETYVFSGDANGPDLTTGPLGFIPITNLEEIFRFDITQNWVTGRWKRISTSPGEQGLHGLRVALVTGTNSWDLNGSLTYYFDHHQRLQRITFRGWTGDSTRLLNLLTQYYEFRSQPTQLAGFYLAQKRRRPTGALLMKHPPVIYADNPVQKLALVLEINNPQGNFLLSNDFRSLIDGSAGGRQ